VPVPPVPAPPVPAPPQPPPAPVSIVAPTAVRKLSGEAPQDLRAPATAQLCIDREGNVTSVQPAVDVDPKIESDVREKLMAWRYEPYRRDGTPLAVCFTTTVQPASLAGGGSGKSASAPAPGAGSGSGKPAPGSGSGSGKPAPGAGSGSGKPAPGGGSGSGKPAPAPGSGSGAKPPPSPPPPPGMPDQLTRDQLRIENFEIEVAECRRINPRRPVHISFWVAPDGRVNKKQVEAAPRVAICIRAALESARFPETRRGGGPFKLDLP
jgi:hypothetical protein